MRAGNLNLFPRLQIQSVGGISPAIIFTERRVNLRRTFKTDLCSSLTPLATHSRSSWRPVSTHVALGFV